MVSDPLTNNKPVKRFNLPNSPGSAPTQLVTLPVPSSLSSLFPFVPPPFRRRQQSISPRSTEISAENHRISAGMQRIPLLGRRGGIPLHPDRISLSYRRKTATSVRISALAPGKKGMREYFAMVMLVDVDLSQLLLICDELHASQRKLGSQGQRKCQDLLVDLAWNVQKKSFKHFGYELY